MENEFSPIFRVLLRSFPFFPVLPCSPPFSRVLPRSSAFSPVLPRFPAFFPVVPRSSAFYCILPRSAIICRYHIGPLLATICLRLPLFAVSRRSMEDPNKKHIKPVNRMQQPPLRKLPLVGQVMMNHRMRRCAQQLQLTLSQPWTSKLEEQIVWLVRFENG